MKSGKVEDILQQRKNMKLRLILQSILVGLVGSLVIVLNRLAMDKFFHMFQELYKSSSGNFLKMLGVLILVGILGLITGRMVRKDPMISGSGIPQVKGRVLNKLEMNWLRILIYKFFGGLMAISVGLSLGREGPSVQIGASVGEGVSERLGKKLPVKQEFLVTAGASAGLTAAFNAPISGILFALEEIHKNFSPLVLLAAMVASLTADFVTKQCLGMAPSLNFHSMPIFPLAYYWTLIVLGIIVAFAGMLFSKGVFIFQDIYAKFKKVPIEVKVMVPFLITAMVGFYAPNLIGGGHELIMSLSHGDATLEFIFIAFCVKLLLLLICFASGVPGGIFLPMLLLGALVGEFVGVSLSSMVGIPSTYIINFIALGMAGYFAVVVKAPITGIMLITEMTGTFENLLALAVVVTVAYIVSEILKLEPIYDALLEKLLRSKGEVKVSDDSIKTILEIPVEVGSIAENKYISEINWPKECLLVAIKRAGKEIIPRGNIKIIGGDYLVVLVNSKFAGKMNDELMHLTLVS